MGVDYSSGLFKGYLLDPSEIDILPSAVARLCDVPIEEVDDAGVDEYLYSLKRGRAAVYSFGNWYSGDIAYIIGVNLMKTQPDGYGCLYRRVDLLDGDGVEPDARSLFEDLTGLTPDVSLYGVYSTMTIC